MKEVSQKTIARIEKIATKVVGKTLGKVLDKSLPQQVIIARRMVRLTGTVDFRARLLDDNGLPADIKIHSKKGRSESEIKAFYWECEEFRSLWVTDLGCSEDILDELIRQSLSKEPAK